LPWQACSDVLDIEVVVHLDREESEQTQ